MRTNLSDHKTAVLHSVPLNVGEAPNTRNNAGGDGGVFDDDDDADHRLWTLLKPNGL